MLPIKGLMSTYENTTLTFTSEGVEVAVSLNIEPKMRQYLSKNNIFKGDKYYIYKLRYHILSKNINCFTIQKVHDTLLNRCMIHCREAKIKSIEREIKKLKKVEYKQSELCF